MPFHVPLINAILNKSAKQPSFIIRFVPFIMQSVP